MDRVGGILNITRSIGDFAMKSLGVTVAPYVKRIVLKQTDKFIIMATDGLWD